MSAKRIRLIITVTLILCAVLPPVSVAASAEKRPQRGLFFMERLTEEDLGSVDIMLLSDLEIHNGTKAIIIALGGNISVNGAVDGIILTFLTNTVSTAKVKYGIINLKYMALPFDMVAGLAVLAVFKDFMEQSAAYLDKNRRGAVKFGFYGYVMAMILIGVFFISVSGAVLAVAGLLALFLVTVAGRVPIAIVVGHGLCVRLRKYDAYLLFAVGIAVIDIVRLLPIVGDIVSYVVMPVLSLGAFSVHIIHKHFYREYIMPHYEKRSKFDRKKISSIILDRGE